MFRASAKLATNKKTSLPITGDKYIAATLLMAFVGEKNNLFSSGKKSNWSKIIPCGNMYNYRAIVKTGTAGRAPLRRFLVQTGQCGRTCEITNLKLVGHFRVSEQNDSLLHNMRYD